MKRILTLILVALSIICISSYAFAEDSTSTRASDYFASYGISLSSGGSGKVNFTMSCESVGTASQLGVSSYTVYRYDDGSWTYITSGSGSYKYNTSSYALSKTFNGVSGEKYRVKCTFLCAKSGGTVETKTYTSRTITAN